MQPLTFGEFMKQFLIATMLISLSAGISANDSQNDARRVTPASPHISSDVDSDGVGYKSGRRYHGTCHILNDQGQSIEYSSCSNGNVTCRNGWGTQCTINGRAGVLRLDEPHRYETLQSQQ